MLFVYSWQLPLRNKGFTLDAAGKTPRALFSSIPMAPRVQAASIQLSFPLAEQHGPLRENVSPKATSGLYQSAPSAQLHGPFPAFASGFHRVVALKDVISLPSSLLGDLVQPNLILP